MGGPKPAGSVASSKANASPVCAPVAFTDIVNAPRSIFRPWPGWSTNAPPIQFTPASTLSVAPLARQDCAGRPPDSEYGEGLTSKVVHWLHPVIPAESGREKTRAVLTQVDLAAEGSRVAEEASHEGIIARVIHNQSL